MSLSTGCLIQRGLVPLNCHLVYVYLCKFIVTSRKGRHYSFYQQFCSVSAGRAICHRPPRAKIMLKQNVRKPPKQWIRLDHWLVKCALWCFLVKYIIITVIIVIIYIIYPFFWHISEWCIVCVYPDCIPIIVYPQYLAWTPRHYTASYIPMTSP